MIFLLELTTVVRKCALQSVFYRKNTPMLTTASAHQESTLSAAPSSASATCPLPPIPKLYDLSGLPHFSEAGAGGSLRRSSTVMPRYPLRASIRATASPVGPPPTTAVDEGGASLWVSAAGAADTAAEEVVVIVVDRGERLLHLRWRSSEVGVLTTQAVAVLVTRHSAERHSSAVLTMAACADAEFMLLAGREGAQTNFLPSLSKKPRRHVVIHERDCWRHTKIRSLPRCNRRLRDAVLDPWD